MAQSIAHNASERRNKIKKKICLDFSALAWFNVPTVNENFLGETKMKTLTMLEMSEKDGDFAEKIAKRLGFTQTAYTSSSDIIGLFCLPDNANHKHGCVIKTKEFGFMFLADLEDMQMHDLFSEQDKLVRNKTQLNLGK